MAEELINMTQLVDQLSPVMLEQFSPLLTLFKAVGIVLLIYVVFLIIKALFRWKTMGRIIRIADNVEEINKKLDVLVRESGKGKKGKGKKK